MGAKGTQWDTETNITKRPRSTWRPRNRRTWEPLNTRRTWEPGRYKEQRTARQRKHGDIEDRETERKTLEHEDIENW
mgnify:CR=1 FL=1